MHSIQIIDMHVSPITKNKIKIADRGVVANRESEAFKCRGCDLEAALE